MPAQPGQDAPLATGTRRTLRIRTGSGAVRSLLGEAALHLGACDCDASVKEDTLIVLAEVLNNVEEHAYEGQADRPVRVDLRVDPDAVRCIVEDAGHPVPAACLSASPMPGADPRKPADWPEGGFGWAIVHRLAGEVGYARRGDRNRLRFSIDRDRGGR
jgi:serine/threonine-protein kinase RsbW